VLTRVAYITTAYDDRPNSTRLQLSLLELVRVSVRVKITAVVRVRFGVSAYG